MVFHDGSNYDYHLIIKELAEEFEGQFKCLGENTQKYTTFSVPIKKELGNDLKITYRIKFVDCARFMASSHYQVLLIILLKDFTIVNTKILNLVLNM